MIHTEAFPSLFTWMNVYRLARYCLTYSIICDRYPLRGRTTSFTSSRVSAGLFSLCFRLPANRGMQSSVLNWLDFSELTCSLELRTSASVFVEIIKHWSSPSQLDSTCLLKRTRRLFPTRLQNILFRRLGNHEWSCNDSCNYVSIMYVFHTRCI